MCVCALEKRYSNLDWRAYIYRGKKFISCMYIQYLGCVIDTILYMYIYMVYIYTYLYIFIYITIYIYPRNSLQKEHFRASQRDARPAQRSGACIRHVFPKALINSGTLNCLIYISFSIAIFLSLFLFPSSFFFSLLSTNPSCARLLVVEVS